MMTPTWNSFKGYLLLAFIAGILVGLLIGIWCVEADAAEIPQETAVRCIVGEAAGEGREGMLWHAAALRNRGTIKGVYGCKSDLVDREPAWVRDRAREAWLRSKYEDPTQGADHWGSTIVDKSWIERMERKMVFAGQVRNTRFYKEVRR